MAKLMHDKIVVITGSSAGIGAATAVEFAKNGAKLVITGRNETALDELKKQCLENGAPEVESVVADIATDEGIDTLVNATLTKFGTIHVLVNNASACHYGDLRTAKGSASELDFVYNLSLRSPWKLCGYFVDELIKNKGNIIFISSSLATLSNPAISEYCIIKAGLNHMTKCMATELGMQGVRVNCVAPAAVLTKFLQNFNVPEDQYEAVFESIAKAHVLEQKVISPGEVAKSILFLASDAANRITGVILPVDCGYVLGSPAYDFAGSQSIPGLEQE